MIDVKRNFSSREFLSELDKRQKFWKKDAIKLSLDTIGKLGVKYMSREAPGKTGKLKKSFSYVISKSGKIEGEGQFTSKEEYAQFVNDGTESSEGGFIPAIEKRLTKRYLRKNNMRSTKLKRHPGTKANAYQERAFQKLDQVIHKEILKEFKKRGYLSNTRGDVA